MMAWVLVLAGVAAGDGGTGMGAAGEPVRATPRWETRWEGEGWLGPDPPRVLWERGQLTLENSSMVTTIGPVSFQLDGTVTISSRPWGTYSLDGDRLTIFCRGKKLFTLKPAARKP